MGQAPGLVSPGEVAPQADIQAWKDEARYLPLLEADRSVIAWEWLRRDAAYREAASLSPRGISGACRHGPEHWGLVGFENPDLAAPLARPIWRKEVHPYVLAAIADPKAEPANSFDLAEFASITTIARFEGAAEHLLLSDGLKTIRIDVMAGSLANGPVRLRYLLAGVAAVERPLLTLRRLLALQRGGTFSRALHPDERRARKWIMMLRTHDGLAAGASQRELAMTLLSRYAEQERWRSAASSLRSQVQRLARASRCLASGGYRALLG
jgi:hypothetical protein